MDRETEGQSGEVIPWAIQDWNPDVLAVDFARLSGLFIWCPEVAIVGMFFLGSCGGSHRLS